MTAHPSGYSTRVHMHSSHGNGGTHVHTCTWQPRHQRKQTWQPGHHATFQEAMALQHTHHGSMASKHTRMHGITPHTPMAAMASTQTDMEAMSSQHTHTHTHGSHSITARAPMALEQTNMMAAAMARCTHTMSWQLCGITAHVTHHGSYMASQHTHHGGYMASQHAHAWQLWHHKASQRIRGDGGEIAARSQVDHSKIRRGASAAITPSPGNLLTWSVTPIQQNQLERGGEAKAGPDPDSATSNLRRGRGGRKRVLPQQHTACLHLK